MSQCRNVAILLGTMQCTMSQCHNCLDACSVHIDMSKSACSSSELRFCLGRELLFCHCARLFFFQVSSYTEGGTCTSNLVAYNAFVLVQSTMRIQPCTLQRTRARERGRTFQHKCKRGNPVSARGLMHPCRPTPDPAKQSQPQCALPNSQTFPKSRQTRSRHETHEGST